MEVINLSIGLAFLAGLVSFFAPCVFTLIPAYISYLGRNSLTLKNEDHSGTRFGTVIHGIAFVVGFSLVFISLGVAFSFLSQFFYDSRALLAQVGGVVVILMGLHMTGLLHIPLLEYDLRRQSRLRVGGGLISSFLMGIFFSAGWSPCVGPTLSLILTLAVDNANIGQGILLLSFYSLGMGIPFLIAAVGIDWVTNVLKKHHRAMQTAQVVMGVILILVGIMLFLGIYQQLLSFDTLIDFGI
jgi:cytochrome c-type biogenesis protein